MRTGDTESGLGVIFGPRKGGMNCSKEKKMDMDGHFFSFYHLAETEGSLGRRRRSVRRSVGRLVVNLQGEVKRAPGSAVGPPVWKLAPLIEVPSSNY